MDDYLVNHPIVKLHRINRSLLGKSRKQIKFFEAMETDETTDLKYNMKNDTPVLMPRI